MKRKKGYIIIATLLLSITSVMALEEFKSPAGTFMKVESQEELMQLAESLNSTENGTKLLQAIYVMIPTPTINSTPENEKRCKGDCTPGGVQAILCCCCNGTANGGRYHTNCGSVQNVCPSIDCGDIPQEGCCPPANSNCHR